MRTAAKSKPIAAQIVAEMISKNEKSEKKSERKNVTSGDEDVAVVFSSDD